MELWWVLALAAAGFVAATSNAAVGIGGGLLVMPLLSLWFPPRLAVAYTIPMFFASTLVIAWRYRGQVDRRFLAWLVPGVLMGIAAGSWFLRAASPVVVRWVMGVTAVFFVGMEAVRLATRRSGPVLPFWSAIPLSLISGLASSMTNLGGTIVSLTMLGRDLPPARFVGTVNDSHPSFTLEVGACEETFTS